jgi:hypothetical protein
MLNELKKTLMTVPLLLLLAQPAFATLSAVGPTDPVNGFPVWYQDSAGTALQIDLVDIPTGTGAPPIPGNAFSQQIGFGAEAFYYLVSAKMNLPNSAGLPSGGNALVEFGVEATFFGGGDPVNGQQFPFQRYRFYIDCPVAGTYTVTHPYGVDTFNAAAPGVRAIKSTTDIGTLTPDFTGPLTGRIGPFLKAAVPTPPAGFIGNAAITQTVTGSPFGTNFVRIDGPAGSNLDGLGHDFIQTDQFTLVGQIFTGAVGTPVTVSRSTYQRTSSGGEVEVFATSATTATVSVSGVGLTTTPMTGDGAGRFFAGIPLPRGAVLPNLVNVTAVSAPQTASTLNSNLVDLVTVSRADYDPASKTLVIEAKSGDDVTPPVLTAAGFGPLVNGVLVVNTVSAPSSVVVTSSLGGQDVRQVTKVTDKNIFKNVIGANLDGVAPKDQIVDLGRPYGIWLKYNDAVWGRLHNSSADAIAVGNIDGDAQGIDDIMIDFGKLGLWCYYNNTTWVKLHDLDPETIAAGDIDGNGAADLIVDFGAELGVWVFYNNSAWAQLHTISPDGISVGNLNGIGGKDVVFDYGQFGIWIYYDNATWLQLHNVNPDSLVVGDGDGNGIDEIVVDFGPQFGFWVYLNNSAWSQM